MQLLKNLCNTLDFDDTALNVVDTALNSIDNSLKLIIENLL